MTGEPVSLCTNKTAAEKMLGDLIRKAELADRGIADPFEAHHKRPLAEHLADWAAALSADGSTNKYVKLTVACARRIIDGCGFVFMADLSSSRVQHYVARLRECRGAVPPLESAREK